MSTKKISRIDWIILVFVILLNLIGLFTLFSITTSNIRGDYFIKEFNNQIFYTIIGYILLIISIYIPFLYLKTSLILITIFFVNVLLLIYTIFWGIEINGVRRWIILSIENSNFLTIQPSEFAKLVLILINSYFLSKVNESNANKLIKIFDFYKIKINKYYLLSIIFSITIIILVFLQKSLSVTLVIIGIYLFMLISSIQKKIKFSLIILISLLIVISTQNIITLDFFTKAILWSIIIIIFLISLNKIGSKLIKPKHFVLILLTNSIIGFFGINFIWNNLLHEYQKSRVINFLNFNEQDLLSEGYQQYQSIISIGAGSFWGQGFMQISNDRVLLLPEPTTDFIFAIFAYKFGFIGIIFILLIYSIIILKILYISDKISDKQAKFILIGVAGMLIIQIFANIGMNLGLLPVGGTTLPFISAGGSSLISMFISIGLVQNCIVNNWLNEKFIKRNDKILIDGWNL